MTNPDPVQKSPNLLQRIAGMGDNNPPLTLEELKALPAADFFSKHDLDKVVTLAHAEFKNETVDVSTKTARDIIIANAFKFSTVKSAFVAKANEQTEEWKKKTKEVNTKRDNFITAMDKLRDETRKPVTDWEDADEKRQNAHKAAFAELSQLSIILPTITSDELRERLVNLKPYQDRDWEEYAKDAAPKLIQTEEFLTSTLDLTVQAESDRAELAKMKADKAAEEAAAEENRRKEQEAEDAKNQRTNLFNTRMRELEANNGFQTQISEVIQDTITRLTAFYGESKGTYEEYEDTAANTFNATIETYNGWLATAIANEEAAATAAATKRAEEIEQAKKDAVAEQQRKDKEAADAKEADFQKRLKNRKIIKSLLLAMSEDIVKASAVNPDKAMQIAIAIMKGKIRHTQIKLEV